MEKRASLSLKTEQATRPAARLLPAPPADSPATVLALIERLALDSRADVEKLERMMAMYEGLKGEGGRVRLQRGEGPDPEKARRHQDRQEQVRSIRARQSHGPNGHPSSL
jgi:hypothetical protein